MEKVAAVNNLNTTKIGYIYFLIDPITGIIRYVGQTKNYKKRYTQHLREGKFGKGYKNNWIKSLLKINEKPIMKIYHTMKVPTCFYQMVMDRLEINAIGMLNTHCGNQLTNETPGGTGLFSEVTKSELSKRMFIDNPAKKVAVLQYDLRGNFIQEYNSITEATEKSKVTHHTIVNSANNNGGNKKFIWRYKTNNFSLKINVPIIKDRRTKEILQYDKNMVLIKEWNSLRGTEKAGYSSSAISRVCQGKYKNHKGFIWKFKN